MRIFGTQGTVLYRASRIERTRPDTCQEIIHMFLMVVEIGFSCKGFDFLSVGNNFPPFAVYYKRPVRTLESQTVIPVVRPHLGTGMIAPAYLEIIEFIYYRQRVERFRSIFRKSPPTNRPPSASGARGGDGARPERKSCARGFRYSFAYTHPFQQNNETIINSVPRRVKAAGLAAFHSSILLI